MTVTRRRSAIIATDVVVVRSGRLQPLGRRAGQGNGHDRHFQEPGQPFVSDCSGGIDSVVELLQGRFSTGVMKRLCRQETGLFPRPSEIRFTCSCADYASM